MSSLLQKGSRARRMLIAGGVLVGAISLMIWLQGPRSGAQDTFQGYVEGNFVYVAPESGGRILALNVSEGDEVKAEQQAFKLDTEIELAKRNEAEARLNQARSQLNDLIAAQQRPEQIAVIRAQEDQARAQLDLATTELERQKALFQRGYSSKAVLDQAQTTFDRAKAALAEAQRQITAAALSARIETIAAGEAAVRAAEAGFAQAAALLEKRIVKIPQDGRVQEIFFRVGEVVNAGQPVLSLLPPGNLKYRFYVPEPLYSTLRLNQEVDVSCDACPSGLRARIIFMSREAEFTPPVIFSDEERAKLVFKVEAKPIEPVDLPIGLPIKVKISNVLAKRG